MFKQNYKEVEKEADKLLENGVESDVLIHKYELIKCNMTAAIACRLLNKEKFYESQVVVWRNGERFDTP